MEDDVDKALMAVLGQVANATKRKVAIIGLKLKDSLKRSSRQTEMLPQAATLLIQSKLESDDSEALRNVATCHVVLHNSGAEFCRGLLKTADAVISLDEDIAVVEPEQTAKVKSNQASEGSTSIGGTKNQ